MISGELFARINKELKTAIQDLPNLTLLSDDELMNIINDNMEKMLIALSFDNGTETAAITFRDKQNICNSVYEAIRGLDVLGTIINDMSITEVMINGPDNIFVERAGKLEKLTEQFESKEVLTDIIIKFVRMRNLSLFLLQ